MDSGVRARALSDTEFIFICSTSDNDAVSYILRVVILFHLGFHRVHCACAEKHEKSLVPKINGL